MNFHFELAGACERIAGKQEGTELLLVDSVGDPIEPPCASISAGGLTSCDWAAAKLGQTHIANPWKCTRTCH